MAEAMQESTVSTNDGRRRFVNPQPKRNSESEGEPARARQRANTSGVARGRKDEVDSNLADAVRNSLHVDDEEDRMSGDKSDKEDSEQEEKDKEDIPEVRVLEDVVSEVMDDVAKEAISRMLSRMKDMDERLLNLQCVCRAQAEMLAEMRMHMGPTLKVFPGKGMTVAHVRSRLVEAFWGGYFGSNNDKVVTGFVTEFEFPPTLQLVMLSVTENTADLVQSLIPGCYPVGTDNSTTQPQQNQCNSTKTKLQRFAKSYYPDDPWTFLCGFPMQRRAEGDDGELGDEDNWSIELVVNKQVQPVITEVLMHVTYCHKTCHQTVTVDERVLIDTMGWQYSDIRASLDHWTKVYRTNVVWVGGDCSTLQVYGKRRFRLSKGDGKGGRAPTIDVTPTQRSDFRLPGQIPQSMQSKGKNQAGKNSQSSQQNVGFRGKPGSQSGGQQFGKNGFKGKSGVQQFGGFPYGHQQGGYKGKHAGQNLGYGYGAQQSSFAPRGPPVGVDGGFAGKGDDAQAQGSNGAGSFPPQMPQVPLQFDPSAILNALFNKGGWPQQY